MTSIRAANKKQADSGEEFHEARADRIIVAGRAAGAGPAERTGIAFDFVANPVRLPHNMYFGEVGASRSIPRDTSCVDDDGPCLCRAVQLLEFDAKGSFIGEMGKNLYAWSFGHTVKVDPQDNVWVTDRVGHRVSIRGPRVRRPQAGGLRRGHRAAEASEAAVAAEDGRFRQVTDVAWDKAATPSSATATSIRASRSRQGRQWDWSGRPRQGARPVSAAFDCDREPAMSMSRTAATTASRCYGDGKFLRQFTIDVPVPLNAKPADRQDPG